MAVTDEIRFASGVYGYVDATATITVHFPVDKRGEADISCKQCPFYYISSRTCGLNKNIVPYGEHFIAPTCPLNFDNTNTKEKTE